MSGVIFYRQRRKVDEGEKKPRYHLVASSGADLKVHARHVRKSELEQMAQKTGAELVELTGGEKKMK
ncbi:MAG: hypothetical protein WAR22_03550 [Desulfomonilia bacterium]|mgnify:CR=1 FL=1|jgi:hypothetical protein